MLYLANIAIGNEDLCCILWKEKSKLPNQLLALIYRSWAVLKNIHQILIGSSTVDQLEIFFEVNNVPMDKQVSSTLTLIGSRMYALLRSSTAPRRPKELRYKEIFKHFDSTFGAKTNCYCQTYKFHKAEQEQSESIRDYLAKLQRLAKTCDFGGYRDEAIRDRLVCGLRNRAIQRKLLGEAELTLG